MSRVSTQEKSLGICAECSSSIGSWHRQGGRAWQLGYRPCVPLRTQALPVTWSPVWVEVAEGTPFLCAPTACCPTPKIYLGVQSVGEASALCSNGAPQMSSPPHRPAPGMAEQKKECFLETQTWVQIWSLPLCPSG